MNYQPQNVIHQSISKTSLNPRDHQKSFQTLVTSSVFKSPQKGTYIKPNENAVSLSTNAGFESKPPAQDKPAVKSQKPVFVNLQSGQTKFTQDHRTKGQDLKSNMPVTKMANSYGPKMDLIQLMSTEAKSDQGHRKAKESEEEKFR